MRNIQLLYICESNFPRAAQVLDHSKDHSYEAGFMQPASGGVHALWAQIQAIWWQSASAPGDFPE